MTNAYCDLADVKHSMSGDVPNVGTSHDQSLAKKIIEVSRDIDRKIAKCRGEPDDLFSFLADQPYGRQIVYVSATPEATDGTFTLSFGSETTLPIVFDADAASVQNALQALDGVGDGEMVVTGGPGGPWTVSLAGSLSGPQAALSGRATMEPTDATITVLPVVSGVTAVPSERIFRAVPDLYGSLLLPIDDCVEVVEVKTYNQDGTTASVLAPNADYRTMPLRGLPVEALRSSTVAWPLWPMTVGVIARWGMRDAVPEDVREVAVIEVIRGHLAALAGNDDRLGMTPFGSVITAKAFTSKFKELESDYGHKLWW